MLVLSRHRDEVIRIGDEIIVWVVDIRGDKVRLGIEAPREVPVHRGEVYEAIRRDETKVGSFAAADGESERDKQFRRLRGLATSLFAELESRSLSPQIRETVVQAQGVLARLDRLWPNPDLSS